MTIASSDFSKRSKSAGATERPRSSEMTPGAGFRIRMNIERPPPTIVGAFRDFETPDISDILNRMYTMSPEIRNVVNEVPLYGPALTVKVFPGDNLMVHKALDAARPGDIVVVDTSGSQRNAVLGDLVAKETATPITPEEDGWRDRVINQVVFVVPVPCDLKREGT